jgi:hypothetical protein
VKFKKIQTIKNMKHLKIIPFAVISGILLSGCVTQQQQAPPQTTSQQISCSIPKIEVVADPVNKETQTKGGLDITIVPALYKGTRIDTTTAQQIQADVGTQILMGLQGNSANTVYVEQDTASTLRPSPDRLEFTVKIHNQLNRVFHGQGSVVQFNVDGTLIPFNNTDYKEFIGGIVPPLNDGDFKIYGPPLNQLKDKGTITIFLYDVITATDVAGNTTEKQNYTWDFTYTMQEVTDTGVFGKNRSIMSMTQYQQILMQQQMQENQAPQQ